MTPYLAVLATAALMAAPLVVFAQSKSGEYTYRCTGNDGKKYYGSTIPNACLGRPLELINKQGLMVRRIDPEGDEKARIAKEAEAEKKRELEAATKDAQRRNRALLATYTSEKDIDQARGRALKENEAAVAEIEKRIVALQKRKEDLKKELDFYQGKNKPPAKLEADTKNNEFDIKTQQGLLDTKKKEVAQINARYDDDRKRYVELTKGSTK